jgi:hypothetical protein
MRPEVKKWRNTRKGLIDRAHQPASIPWVDAVFRLSLCVRGIRTKIWFSTLLGCPYIFNGKSARRDWQTLQSVSGTQAKDCISSWDERGLRSIDSDFFFFFFTSGLINSISKRAEGMPFLFVLFDCYRQWASVPYDCFSRQWSSCSTMVVLFDNGHLVRRSPLPWLTQSIVETGSIVRCRFLHNGSLRRNSVSGWLLTILRLLCWFCWCCAHPSGTKGLCTRDYPLGSYLLLVTS